jgi:hypothetical protein
MSREYEIVFVFITKVASTELPEMFQLVATADWDSTPPPPAAAPTAVPA